MLKKIRNFWYEANQAVPSSKLELCWLPLAIYKQYPVVPMDSYGIWERLTVKEFYFIDEMKILFEEYTWKAPFIFALGACVASIAFVPVSRVHRYKSNCKLRNIL